MINTLYCKIYYILKSFYWEIVYPHPFIISSLFFILSFSISLSLIYFWISKHNFVSFKTLSSFLLSSLIQFVLISRVPLLESYYERLIEPISTTSLPQTASLNPLSRSLSHTLSKPLFPSAPPNLSYSFFQGCFASLFTSNLNLTPLSFLLSPIRAYPTLFISASVIERYNR